MGAVDRNALAAVELETGRLTAWNPGTDGYVKELAVSGTTLYVRDRKTIAAFALGKQSFSIVSASQSVRYHFRTWSTITISRFWSVGGRHQASTA